MNVATVIVILVFFTLTYACNRNHDEKSKNRSIRSNSEGTGVQRNARKKAKQAMEEVEEGVDEVVEVVEFEQNTAFPPILEDLSPDDELTILDAASLIEEITEDGNTTVVDEEDAEIILNPRKKKCKASAITPLDNDQKATLDKHKQKIKVLERNHRVLKKINAKRGVVKLTKRQRIEVKAYLSGAFMKAESLPDIGGGAVSNSTSSRRRRNSNNTYRVCEPVYSWNNVFLTIDSNGTLVQVIQLNEDDTYQWFMEETCQSRISSIVNADCDEAERLHLAYVINLTTGEIEQTYVVVYCCVGLSVL